MVLAHSDFDFHTAVGIIAQHFNDFRYGRAVLLGVSLNFTDNDLTGLRFKVRYAFRFQNNALIQAFVFRLQNRHAAIHIKTADHFRLRTLHHIQNRTFATASAVNTGRAHGNNIPVHHTAHLTLIQNEIALTRRCERHGKTKAVFMRFDTAFNQCQFFCRAYRATSINQHLAITRHRFQTAFEKFIFIFCNRQFMRQSFDFCRHTFLFQ